MTQRNIEDIYPLSPMQQGMLFHTLYAPESETYIELTSCTLRGPLDTAAFAQAWQRVMDRHPILRTSFIWDDVDEPVQVVQRGIKAPLAILDWRETPPAQLAARLEARRNEERAASFALAEAPLMRLLLIRTGEESHEFIWTHHHALLDGWSLPILLREVLTFYEAFSQGKTPIVPASRPYRDYIAWLKRQPSGHAEAYWRAALAGVSAPTPLAVDHAPDLAAPERYAEQEIWLSADASAALQALARQHQLTVNTLVAAAWGLLLARYSGRDDVVFGATVSGRPTTLPGAEGMVGLFINTLPVRVQVDPTMPLLRWLQRLQDHLADARQFEYAPLVDIHGWSETPRDQSLFDSILVFENYPIGEALAQHRGSLALENVRSLEQTNFPLTFVSGLGQKLLLKLSFDCRRFDAPAIDSMLAHLRTLLEAMPAQLERPVGDLPLLPAPERQQILVDWNATARSFPAADERGIHELFEAQAAATPDALAAIFPGEADLTAPAALTYRELDARANQLAHALHDRGVRPGMLVGLYVEKSPEMLVGLLGILKAGAAYLPLDPSYPPERLRFMLEDSGIRVLVTQERVRPRLNGETFRGLTVRLDADWPEIAHSPVTQLPSHPAMSHLAYVIYTSGSTGAPKGVWVRQRNLVNHACALAEATGLGPGDRVLQFISLSFDAAGEEIYPALISGATLVAPAATDALLGRELFDYCAAHEVSVLHMPASVWHTAFDDLAATPETGRDLAGLGSLRLLMLGGDAPSPERLRAFTHLLGREIAFMNLYGPTEATITATFYRTTTAAPGQARLPIGQPIANARTYVLDAHQRPVPVGVPGELYIGGAGVAAGYLGRPELTAEKFVPDPFAEVRSQASGGRELASDLRSPTSGPRLYRTGDLARWLPDGNLEFLGRNDDQVKIRGFRVELGEIEAALRQHPTVREAVVAARGTPGDPAVRLVAYVVPRAGSEIDPAGLRSFLGQRLPPYMAPAAFVQLEAIPLSPTGKVDRRALPDPAEIATEPTTASAAPRTAREELIAGIFAQLLATPSVGIHDSFFDLGGHSLLTTRLASRLRELFGVDVPLRALFDAPTVAGIAATVEARQAAGGRPAQTPIERADRDAPLPLSFAQQRLWFLDQLEPGNLFYNIPTAIRLSGPLDVDALRNALNTVIRRHEVLRTTFAVAGGKPIQVIAPELILALPVTDVSAAADPEAEALRIATAEARLPFDLASGPLLRGKLLRLSDQAHLAIFVIHHVAADGWSLGILVGELAALYEAYKQGEVSAASASRATGLADLPIQYADYAAWQRATLQGEALGEQIAYWREQLAGTPPLLELPTDRPRPAVQTANGATYAFELPEGQARAIKALSQREGVTLYMTLLASYQTLLARYSGQNDICVGSVVANRTRAEVEPLIGFFVNTLVFRTQFTGAPTFRQLLGRVREMALAAYAHQDVPFETLVEALQPERNLSHTPLFQAAFSLQNTPMPARELTGLSLRAVKVDSGATQFDMLLTISETATGLAGAWEYNTDLFDPATIARMAGHLQVLLAAAVAAPDQPVARLPLLTAVERQQLLGAWNATATPFPDQSTLHALVEAQAAAQPEALAAIFARLDDDPATEAARTLSYRQLDQRANQLARHLQARGVTPNTLVGLLVERSLDMVVGLLGILKAGGAFLPLDPAYPPDRLRFMIEDSGIKLLLTQERVLAAGAWKLEAGNQNLALVRLDADWPTIARQPATNLPIDQSTNHLAYVIYTSGSTGRPKGALLAHRGLCNLADLQGRTFDIRPGKRVLQFSPFSFDAAVWEIVMALRNGATLVLTPQATIAAGPELVKLLRVARITTVTLPPSLLAVLEPDDLPDLETVIAAGERCTNEIVAQWAPGRRFFNAYGPTETTVCATLFECDPAAAWPFGGPPIGRPIANCQLYVVDDLLQPVPIGVPGELLIGGVGLAQGYLARPELTAERFVPHPFAEVRSQELEVSSLASDLRSPISDLRAPASDSRLYRSGDRVRWRADGNLEYLGRLDDQVKLRGFRIELGEVEAVLRDHPAVQDAVVAVRGDTLAAYVILEAAAQVTAQTADPATAAATLAAALRTHLRSRLAEYMVPAAFMALDAFPRSPAGKVERKALPAPDTIRQAAAAYVAPRDPAEEKLAALCADLLNLERVGVEDNFFELGGHSLLATQLLARIRDDFQIELPLRTLFEQPTVAGLAQALEDARRLQEMPGTATPPQAPAITARSRAGRRTTLTQLDDEDAGTRGALR